MNARLTRLFISVATAITIVACSESVVNSAGIGGSGYISSGSISGFGSVFVNGVEFQTNEATTTYDVDGNPGTELDLAIGMVVQVSGTINDDGITGIATGISFDDELQGPVSGLAPINPLADNLTRTFSVLGVNVVIDSSSTSFDISDPAATDFGFTSIANDNNVEISGFFNQAGELIATRVELKDINFVVDRSIVEIKGNIISSGTTTFSLEGLGLTVDASGATLEDLPNGLENGQLVEVVGTLDAGLTSITATKVEGEDNSIADTNEFELEGIITDYNFPGDTDFYVSGILVDASNVERIEPSTLILDNNLRIEVEGEIRNGVLIANEIELEGGDLKVHAKVSSVDPIAGTFEVTPVTGKPVITVTVSSDTQLEDDVHEPAFTLVNLLNKLNDTHFVEVHGFDDGNGGIIATEVDIKEPGDVVVQGYATDATGDAAGGTMTVFGITFFFNNTITDFEIDSDIENVEDTTMSGAEINELLSVINNIEPQLVTIKDTSLQSVPEIDDGIGDGTADEIEIENEILLP